MKKIILFAAMALLLFQAGSFAQKSIWDSPDAYLGEKPPGDTPIVFAPGRLADTAFWVGSRVAFTDDGREFLYGRNTTWFDGKNQKLMSYRFGGKKWHGPVILYEGFSTPTFSTDRKTLFLAGSRGEIYQTFQTDSTDWGKPVEFLKRGYALYNFMPTNSGHYYVGSNGTWGTDYNSWRFSILAGTGSDSSITSLGEPLNSPGFNGDFYIAPDESYMIISAKETPTFESELYISFRKPDHQWTVPSSLGPLINNGLAHRWGAYVSPDGKYLFYTMGTSEKDCTIWWVRFDQLLIKLRTQNPI